jgi:hypothetical protein
MTHFNEVCETVTIQTDKGPVVINKSDFDEKKHKLAKAAKHEEPALKSPPNIAPTGVDSQNTASVTNVPGAPGAPAMNVPNTEGTGGNNNGATVNGNTTFVPPADVATRQFFVNKTGKRWFITDDKGAKFDDIGQPENGFDSDGDAGTYVGKLRDAAAKAANPA